MAHLPIDAPGSTSPSTDARIEFDTFMSGFEAAALHGPLTEHWIELAGQPVLLRFAGGGLEPRLWPPLAHLECPPAALPSLTVCAWDTRSTGIEMPRGVGSVWDHLAADSSAALPRGEIFAAFALPALSMLDAEASVAGFWVRDSETLPYWEWGEPFRNIFHWWGSRRNMLLVHGAVVGHDGVGALIVGPSGSGKSSTALGAVLGGFTYLGDDRCFVSLGGQPRAFNVYATAKLPAANLDRFPALRPLMIQRGEGRDSKPTVLLNEHFPTSLGTSLPLRAVLMPHISGKHRTAFVPASPGAALRSIAPHTLLHLPVAGGRALAFMAELTRRVPAWTLELGADSEEVTESLRCFLKSIPQGEQ